MPVVSFDSLLVDQLEKLASEYPYIRHAIVRGTWEEWPCGSDSNDTWGSDRGRGPNNSESIALESDSNDTLDLARRRGFDTCETKAIAKFLAPEAHDLWAIMSSSDLTFELNEWTGFFYDRAHRTLDQNVLDRNDDVLRTFSIIAEECMQSFAKSGPRMLSDVSTSGQSARSKWLTLVYMFLQPNEERLDLGDGRIAICRRRASSIFATSLALVRSLQGNNAPSPKRIVYESNSPTWVPVVQEQIPDNIFRRCGGGWQVRFKGRKTFTVLPWLGASYIHYLLVSPNEPRPAIDIVCSTAVDVCDQAVSTKEAIDEGLQSASNPMLASLGNISD